MINASYVLLFSDRSYARRQLRPMFLGGLDRLSNSFGRYLGLDRE